MKELIRKRIKEKFKTIDNFAKHIGVPRTTLNFVLKTGIGSSKYDTVCKILKELDIQLVEELPVVLDDEAIEFLRIYSSLDDVGRHTVLSVAETEYRRMHAGTFEDAIIAAYGSIDSSRPLTEDEKMIFNLVEKIKNKDNDEK